MSAVTKIRKILEPKNRLLDLMGNKEDRLFQYEYESNTLTLQTDLKSYLDTNRKFMIRSCLNQLSSLKKETLILAEIGVCYGGNLEYIHKLMKLREQNADIYAFDTFEGHPHVDQAMDNVLVHKVGKFFLKNRKRTIKKLQEMNVSINVGDVMKTFDISMFPDGIDFLHLDTDLYQSTKFILALLPKVLNSRGICVIDDYLCSNTPGVLKAVQESNLKTNFIVIESPFNQLILIRI